MKEKGVFQGGEEVVFESIHFALMEGYIPGGLLFSLLKEGCDLGFGRLEESYWEMRVVEGKRTKAWSVRGRVLRDDLTPPAMRKPYVPLFRHEEVEPYLLPLGVREAAFLLGHIGAMRERAGVYPSVAERALGIKEPERLWERRLALRGELVRAYVRALVLWGEEEDWARLPHLAELLAGAEENLPYLERLVRGLLEVRRGKRVGRRPSLERSLPKGAEEAWERVLERAPLLLGRGVQGKLFPL